MVPLYVSTIVWKINVVLIHILAKTCKDGSQEYQPGESYVTANCLARCTCSKEGNGNSGCVSLCPKEARTCAAGDVEIVVKRKEAGTNCTCPKPGCKGELLRLVKLSCHLWLSSKPWVYWTALSYLFFNKNS